MKSIKQTTSLTVWVHRLLDAFIPILLLRTTSLLYNGSWSDKYSVLGLFAGLLLVIFNQGTGVYSQWRGRTLLAGSKLIAQAWVFTWLALMALAFLFKDSSHFSRVIIVSWAIITPITLFLYRFLLRFLMGYLRQGGFNNTRVAIIGAGELGKRLAETFQDAKMLGYSPIAFYDDNPSKVGTAFQGIPVEGSIDDFLARNNKESLYDEVYITLPLRSEERIKYLLDRLADSTLTVKFIPDCFAFDLLHSRYTDIGGLPIISLYDSPLNTPTNRFIKRSEDILLSVLILLGASTVMLGIAIAIKVTSKGPVIFKQKRYGLNGKEIWVWKFRSMKVAENDEKEIKQAQKNDPRLTPIGSFLRRTSLDELPQFFNSLTGRMSVVGPRPHAKAHNEQYRQLIPKYMLRHKVKPGITGWAQIHGLRGETKTLEKMEQRVQYDLYYIDNWSVWLDFKIVLLTVIKGFINKNAY
jgi:putative colanic acid biosynthesis UDP-glucose lipid carrier transferase